MPPNTLNVSAPEIMIAVVSQRDVDTNNASLWRKCMIVFTTSWVTLSACFSSTIFFSVVTEIAIDFQTSPNTISLANAAVLLALGMSTLVWGPVEILLGRHIAYNGCICVLLALTIVAAVVPHIQGFIIVRVLSGFQGTYFHVAAQTIFAENFSPAQRGTATGFFLSGVVLGSPLGPLVAAIIVTYRSWRVILWLQAGMLALGLALSLLFVEFGPSKSEGEKTDESWYSKLKSCNPWKVFEMMRYPNVLTINIACGFLAWPQFALLATPRHVISSRFQFNTPIIAGLFYLAPACGFLVGSIVGGRLSDRTVKRWIKRRDGVRLPPDRLRSGFVSFFILIPSAYLTFGWGMECQPCSRLRLILPVTTAFIVAAGIFDAMTGINTYCAEVVPDRRRDVIASKYMVQYLFSAVASGCAVLLIDAVGLGPACTINVFFVLVSGALTAVTARYGSKMQRWAEGRA